jgi:hypothetical protein
LRERGRAEVGSVSRSSPYRNKNSGNGKNGKIELNPNNPNTSLHDPGSRSPEIRNKEPYIGIVGKRGQKGLTIQMSFFTCSIFHLLSVYPHHHQYTEQRLSTALLINIISPSLEYSPDDLDNNIKELGRYESSKNISHGWSGKLFIINPERESSHVKNEVNNFEDSFIVKLQKWHEIYHGIWKHDDMKRVEMEPSEERRKSLSERTS